MNQTLEDSTITLPDGRVFPVYEGEPLAWSLGLYFTINEEKFGYPRMRAVYKAAKEHRPELIAQEERMLLRAQFDRVFGRMAKKHLDILRFFGEDEGVGRETDNRGCVD